MEVLVRTPELVVLLLQLSTLVLGDAISEFTRYDFPSDFVFGAGTSSYQEDVELMSSTGLEGYRFSLSWSRILPSGSGDVNYKGVEYYNHVIDELVKYGIQPQITMYHYDFPQALEEEYGGWLNPKIIDDFKYFAEVCFREFGNRVKHWTTMNESSIVALYAYDYGNIPPQRCSYPFGVDCRGGNSSTEPYIAAHNMILAHSAAVQLYRTKYQAIQKGKIGINMWTLWTDPLTADSVADQMAAQRALQFMIGWFLDPLAFGDYPNIMKKLAGSRLPSFNESESQMVKGAFDFIGVNYYFSLYVANNPLNRIGLRDMSGDMFAKFTAYKEKSPIDKILPPDPLPKDPRGLPKLLKYLKDAYGNPVVYIQENGFGVANEDSFKDTHRISYLSGFIGSTLEALREGSDVRGYSVWSFVDLFELSSGFSLRIGLYHVDFLKNLERIPKQSAIWYSNFLKNGSTIKIEDVGQWPTAHLLDQETTAVHF